MFALALHCGIKGETEESCYCAGESRKSTEADIAQIAEVKLERKYLPELHHAEERYSSTDMVVRSEARIQLS